MERKDQIIFIRSQHPEEQLLEVKTDLNATTNSIDYELTWLDDEELLKIVHKKHKTTVYVFYSEIKYMTFIGDNQPKTDKYNMYQLNYNHIGG